MRGRKNEGKKERKKEIGKKEKVSKRRVRKRKKERKRSFSGKKSVVNERKMTHCHLILKMSKDDDDLFSRRKKQKTI